MGLLVRGMLGLGDCIRQRCIIRQWLKTDEIWLETSWPCLYHDFGSKLHFVNYNGTLRTQTKNANREKHLMELPPPGLVRKEIRMMHAAISLQGSMLGAMLYYAKCDKNDYDFSIPVPIAWHDKVDAILDGKNLDRKPIMFYRPLVVRTEWRNSRPRNPDYKAYDKLLNLIRDRYFIISVADLQPGIEWIVGEPFKADLEFHGGELDCEMLIALAKQSSLVFAAPGFATVMAQAVGTPSVCIYGGHETPQAHSLYPKTAPHLSIVPIKPCACFTSSHMCDKTIDITKAETDLLQFCDGLHG